MDRQDIDALLIGALYGELTPADEARLAAHLEAHPADRGALDDLKSARAQVRQSRIFDEAPEPPQHISALLLQEAHRRAPKAVVEKEREGWFFRFSRMFLMHPAMAAAAMLVLVVGVASTLYVKKGATGKREAPTVAATSPSETAATPDMAGAGSAAYSAGLADEKQLAEATKEQESATGRWEEGGDKNADSPALAKGKAGELRNRGAIAVATDQQQQPKDFERAKDMKVPSPAKSAAATRKADTTAAYGDLDGAADDRGDSTTVATGSVGGGYGRGTAGPSGAATGGAGMATPPPAAPPPPPAQAPTIGNFANAPAPKAEAEKKMSVAQNKPAPVTATPTSPTAVAQDSTLVGWAKSTHAQAIAKVKNGDCNAAAQLALTVSNRAPEYYSQYMATDRQLKSCKPYIEAAREKEAAKAAKARAQKPTSADEAAPAPTTTK